MSHSARPISPASFAAAIRDLPAESLYAKHAELQNSVDHLLASNAQLRPLARDGDAVCSDALRENKVVIRRVRDRMLLLRHEIETLRGMRWEGGEDNEEEEDEDEDEEMEEEGREEEAKVNGVEEQRAETHANAETHGNDGEGVHL
jgi:hypothetical protein